MILRIVDCTIRDGGNQNNWNFQDQDLFSIVENLDASGIDIIEVGYVGGSGSNKSNGLGKSAFLSNAFLRSLPKPRNSRLAVMVVPSVCPMGILADIDRQLVSVVRVAAYPHDLEKALSYIHYLKNLGFQICLNLMAASYATPKEIAAFAKRAETSEVDVFYIADSFGSMTPDGVEERIRAIKQESGCHVGFHGHNNLGLAAVNGLKAIESGATYVDTSLCGMARGAGNLPTEQFIGALLHWNKFGAAYRLEPVLEAAEYVLQNILKQPMRISSPEIICGVSNLHYYYYDLIIDQCEKHRLHPLEVAKSLGNLQPRSVETSFIESVIERLLIQDKM